MVKRRTRDREVPGSIPTNCKCCFLEQETLSTLLSTGFYPGKKRATWKISTRLLNVLPSINKVDYYYFYLFKIVTGQCVICAQKRCRPGFLSGKNKKYNKLSSVKLAMGQLIRTYLVCVGEFLVCMQFNAKKKKKK